MKKYLKYFLIGVFVVAGLIVGVLFGFDSELGSFMVEGEVNEEEKFLSENLDKDYRELLDNFLMIEDDELKSNIAFGGNSHGGERTLHGEEVHGVGIVLDIPTVFVRGGDRKEQYLFFELYIGDEPWNGENITKFLKKYPNEKKYVIGAMLDVENEGLSVGDRVEYRGTLITIPFEHDYGQSYLDHSEIQKIE